MFFYQGPCISAIRLSSSTNQFYGPTSQNVDVLGCKLMTISGLVELIVVYRRPFDFSADDDAIIETLEVAGRLPSDLILFGDFIAPAIDWKNWTCSAT